MSKNIPIFKHYNSSELAKQVSEKLGLNQEDSLRLYKELSQVSSGMIQQVLDMLTQNTAPEVKGTLKLNLSCPNCGNTTWTETTDGGEQCFKCLACGDLCNPEDMCTEPVEVVDGQKSKLTAYAACIKGTCVRNAQYSQREYADPADDNAWIDAEINWSPLFLEIIEAETKTRAKQLAASHIGVSEDIIELYPMN